MVQPPNALQGLNSLSSILDVQQRQQNLQTGAYRQQEAQAGASQAQQENTEKQALAQFTRGAVHDPSYLNPDGTANVQKFQQGAMAVAPVYGQSYIGQASNNFTAAVENRKALLGLTNDQRATAGNYFAAVAANPNADREDFIKAAQAARTVSSDQGYQDFIDHMLAAMPPTGQMRTQDASTAVRQHARTIALGTGAAGAGQSNPNITTVNTLGGVQPIQTNPQSPLGTGPAARPIPGSSLPAIAGATAAATGEVGTDNAVFARTMAAGANSQRGIELAQKVEQEAGMVRTGQFSQEFANRLTILQQHDPSITARQLLQKDAMNLKTLAEEGATTDAERNQIGGGFPSPETMDPDAVQKAARYWQGAFRMAGARRDNAVAHVSQNGTAGLALRDAAFMSTASPGKFAPPEPKKILPTGAKLDAYVKAHPTFGGDATKAISYLKQQGYE